MEAQEKAEKDNLNNKEKVILPNDPIKCIKKVEIKIIRNI
jgi:hypothetical protein